jgi:hypothetical protein
MSSFLSHFAHKPAKTKIALDSLSVPCRVECDPCGRCFMRVACTRQMLAKRKSQPILSIIKLKKLAKKLVEEPAISYRHLSLSKFVRSSASASCAVFLTTVNKIGENMPKSFPQQLILSSNQLIDKTSSLMPFIARLRGCSQGKQFFAECIANRVFHFLRHIFSLNHAFSQRRQS